jgi:hypothetical protein
MDLLAIAKLDISRSILLAPSGPTIFPTIEGEIADKSPRAIFLKNSHVPCISGLGHLKVDVL